MSHRTDGVTRSAARLLPARATTWLIATGHVTPAALHRHGLVARDVSQSNAVAIVEVGDGTGYAVKDMSGHDDLIQGSPAQELAFYDIVRREDGLPLLSPRPIDLDASARILVLEALVRHRRMDHLLAHRDLLDPDLASAIGAALGSWHWHARNVSTRLPLATPWVVRMDCTDRLAVLDQPPYADVLATIIADPVLAAVPVRCRQLWSPDTYMHGDVRFANLLVATSPPDVRLVDWETSGRGDHRWDLAGVLQEYVVRGSAVAGDGTTAVGRADLAAEACRAAYAHAWRSADPWPHLTPFIAARLIMRAFQLASWQQSDIEELNRHLEIARRLLADETES